MAYIFWFKKDEVYKTLPHPYFGSLSSSDSTTLSSNTFEVSNIYNCHFIEVYCLNAYLLFAVITQPPVYMAME